MNDSAADESGTTKRWILIATIFVVIGYSWLASRLSEPKLVFPDAVHNAVWVEGKQMRSLRGLSQFGPSQFREWARVFSQAKRLSHELSLLGPFDQRVDLLIDVDDRMAYSVSDRRIEIGLDIAASDGQILKALIKAWLFQKAAPAIQASQLRMEVASDVAVGMIRGRFHLGTPKGEALQLPAVENWLQHVRSFANSCDELWLPFEIGNFCGSSDNLNPLMLRPLLTAMVMESYQSIPPFQRLNFARQWFSTLKEESTLGFRPVPVEISSWKTWVREEAEGFMRLAPEKMKEKIQDAGLAEESPLKVDFQLHMEDWKSRSDLLRKHLVALVISAEGKKTLEPLGLQLSNDETEQISTATEVWANCPVPTIQELLNSKVPPKTILVLPCSGQEQIEFSGMIRGGIQIFARENRTVPFIHLNRSALALALSKHVIDRSVTVDVLMGDGNKLLSPLLGLDKAVWSAPMHAYRVVGAIEAVDWYRSQNPPPSQANLQAP